MTNDQCPMGWVLRKICNPRQEALLRRRWGRRQGANFTSCAPLEPSFRRIEFRRIEFGVYNGYKACSKQAKPQTSLL